MSEIVISLEHPSLGCGEVIARYDLSEVQEKAYIQGKVDGRAEAIDEFLKKDKECQQKSDDCPYMNSEITCVECIAEQLKGQK